MESYPGAIVGTDGLAAGWRADYADARRRRAPARYTGSVGDAKEELAVSKDGSRISELSVDAAAPREPVAEAAAAVGETTPGGPASGTRRCC